VDALGALVRELLTWLYGGTPEVCPGGWAWAATALGIALGYLPALGALLGAWSRRGAVAAVSGLVCAGVLPLLVFTAVGQVFTAAARASARVRLEGLRTGKCFGLTQAQWLTGTTVGEAFDGRPLLVSAAVFAFGVVPLGTAVCVGIAARVALRRGPRWPVQFYWLPVLVLPGLTAATPAGASAHLWLGASLGALAGIPTALAARPSRRHHRIRGVRAGVAPARPGAGPGPAGPPAQRAAAAAEVLRGRARRGAHALARRFAARAPVPPLVLPPEAPGPRPPSPSSPSVPPPGPRPPTLVLPEQRGTHQRFRLLRRLGAGGFGRVWLAHDAHLGQTVALKSALAPDAETEERIRREARALAQVRHENCVRIHDLVHAGSDPGLDGLSGLVIVMEYVDGAPLGELVAQRGPLDDRIAAHVWAGLADGLDTAHRRGVLHRDVKPANVVVDAAGVPHLIDFGIARSAGDSTLTLAGFVLGTPDFMPPEVAAGAAATPASDTWQLAATVSFAMTGHPPRGEFADAVSGLRAAALGAPVTHLPARTAHAALLRAALATDPARRPSLAQTHAALRSWLRRTGSSLSGTVPHG